jgi:hypothetical protein
MTKKKGLFNLEIISLLNVSDIHTISIENYDENEIRDEVAS